MEEVAGKDGLYSTVAKRSAWQPSLIRAWRWRGIPAYSKHDFLTILALYNRRLLLQPKCLHPRRVACLARSLRETRKLDTERGTQRNRRKHVHGRGAGRSRPGSKQQEERRRPSTTEKRARQSRSRSLHPTSQQRSWRRCLGEARRSFCWPWSPHRSHMRNSPICRISLLPLKGASRPLRHHPHPRARRQARPQAPVRRPRPPVPRLQQRAFSILQACPP